MNKIPADILTNAAAAVEAMPQRPPFKADVLSAIAHAILAERKRCAEIARTLPGRRYADNVGSINVPPTAEDIAKAIEAYQ